jgi:very-short-patch-repair endonuclease
VSSAAALAFQIKVMKLPPPVEEYRFCPRRRWRADFCWPDFNLIVEFEGGAYTQGRHTRGKGFENDIVKYNTAALMGFTVLRFTATHVRTGLALQHILKGLKRGGCNDPSVTNGQ